jgi:hypothetical protein
MLSKKAVGFAFGLFLAGRRSLIGKPTNPSQQVVRRDHLIEAKLVKELPLISVLSPHHRRPSSRLLSRNHCSLGSSSSLFDNIGQNGKSQCGEWLVWMRSPSGPTRGCLTARIDRNLKEARCDNPLLLREELPRLTTLSFRTGA